MDEFRSFDFAKDVNPTNAATPQPEAYSENDIGSWFWITTGFIDFLIFLANGLLAYAIIRSARLHHSTNWFILSLAVSGFFSGLFVIPSSMICSIWLTCNNSVRLILTDLVVYVSMSNVCVMSLDRLAAVEFPMRYHSMVVHRVKFWIILAWLVPAIISAVPLCWMFAEAGSAIVKINKLFQAVKLFVFELLPCAIMILAHGRIFFIRRRHSRQISLETQSSTDSSHRTNFRVKRSLGAIAIIILLFVFCWFSSIVLTSCKHFNICQVPRNDLYATALLVFIDPVVNSLICLFFKTDIRKELLKLFDGRITAKLE